jgi:hypothetical protein
MFSSQDDTIINYVAGLKAYTFPLNIPYEVKEKHANNVLISAYTTIRANCEEACSVKLLSDYSDEEKVEYRNNSKISQIRLKTRDNETQLSFDSCLRKCFVKRVTQHFGKETQDLIYSTAFEYQQKDIHFFHVQNISQNTRNKKVDIGSDNNQMYEKILNDLNSNI